MSHHFKLIVSMSIYSIALVFADETLQQKLYRFTPIIDSFMMCI